MIKCLLRLSSIDNLNLYIKARPGFDCFTHHLRHSSYLHLLNCVTIVSDYSELPNNQFIYCFGTYTSALLEAMAIGIPAFFLWSDSWANLLSSRLFVNESALSKLLVCKDIDLLASRVLARPVFDADNLARCTQFDTSQTASDWYKKIVFNIENNM